MNAAPFHMFLNGLNFELPDFSRRDTSEKVLVSSLALLKMMKHAVDESPMTALGLMLGIVVDELEIRVVDVISLPQSAALLNDAYKAEDHVKTIEMLAATGRREKVVGWYRSNPGFGVRISGDDIENNKAFLRLDDKAIAVIIDPIKRFGKVKIGAFRGFDPWEEPRETMTNVGLSSNPSEAFHNRNAEYYHLIVEHERNKSIDDMISAIYADKWSRGFTVEPFDKLSRANEETAEKMRKLSFEWPKAVDEDDKPPEGLGEAAEKALASNTLQVLGSSINRAAFFE